MAFANVDIGDSPADGTGDPLRTAFSKINQNFANITTGLVTINAPVQSVVGRTGNVIITINDIIGGISRTNTQTLVNAANTASVNYTDQAISNLINSAPGLLDTLGEIAANLASGSSVTASIINLLTSTNANVTAANSAIGSVDSAWQANAATQHADILGANAAIVTANVSLKDYFDDQLTANTNLVLTYSDNLNSGMVANITAANLAITTLYSNAAVQSININAINANITAANAAIAALQSNAAIQASILDTLTSNAASQSQTLNTLTSNAASQSDELVTLLGNAVSQHSELVSLTANAASQAVGLIDLISNAASQNNALFVLDANVGQITLDISTIDANLGTLTTTVATIDANVGQITLNFATLDANVGQITTSISTINANLGAQSNTISVLDANLGLQTTALTTLDANVGQITLDISTIDANLGQDRKNQDTFNANLGQFSVNFATLDANVGQITLDISTIDANLGTLTTTVATIDANLGTLTTTVGTIDANLGQITTDLNTINANITAANLAITDLENAGYITSATANVISVNGQTGTVSLTIPTEYGNTDVSTYLPTYTGTLSPTTLFTSGNTTVSGILQVGAIVENFTSNGTPGTVTDLNWSTGGIYYLTNLSANITANLQNVTIPAGTVSSVSLWIQQGGTPYVPTALKINDAVVTINWAGTTTAPGGNASKQDLVSFTIMNNAGTYNVLGQLSTYG